jgi:hypothetical protein
MLQPEIRSRLDPADSTAHLNGVRPHKDAARLQDSGSFLEHILAGRRGQLVEQVDASNLDGTAEVVIDKQACRASMH